MTTYNELELTENLVSLMVSVLDKCPVESFDPNNPLSDFVLDLQHKAQKIYNKMSDEQCTKFSKAWDVE